MSHSTVPQTCFHCGLPIDTEELITVKIGGKLQPMCCYGCQSVAQAIVNAGMEDFYSFRTKNPIRPKDVVPEFIQQLKIYDNPTIQQHITSKANPDDSDIKEVSLILEGIVCAACIWLNENHLGSLPGVISVNINYTTHRAIVRWNNSQITLSEILEAITRIGYKAHPYDPNLRQKIIEKERKQHIQRIGIAAVLGMQIMILAVAMYTGEWWGMDESFMKVFRWISLGITTPLLLYASKPFFSAALRDFANRKIGMDVPVSLGLGIAFSASLVNTINNTGDVYYDSIAMFTFLLLTARFFELSARKRTAENTETLLNLQPTVATKIIISNNQKTRATVPVAELEVGDLVIVKPGENIPADGTITEGISGINESLITGESMPVTKSRDDTVIGGSTNIESPLVIRVNKIGNDTVLASVQKLIDAAQSNKPSIAILADRIASKFLAAILLLSACVAVYWYINDTERWIAITVATLVVTCPCALSLATPVAMTAASGQLARLGLLPTSVNALETLARATDFVFDKTGTLTKGKIKLIKTVTIGNRSTEDYLNIAAALEAGSEHPIATSLIEAANSQNLEAKKVKNVPGKGISGIVDTEYWFLGNLNFIEEMMGNSLAINSIKNDWHKVNPDKSTVVILANEKNIGALFILDDEVREGAQALTNKLHEERINLSLLTGDRQEPAVKLADSLNIEHIYSNMTPASKLDQIRSMQERGAIVVMTGDGINDAPVLAGANVSIAMGSGTQLAAMHADMILISSHVEHIYDGYLIAINTIRIIKQNLSWAIGYNLLAIPAAAAGYVEPWLAAIGMSASSLIVVLNALRLTKKQTSST